MEAPVRASDHLSALTSIIGNVERKTEKRKQNEFNERIQEIQVRSSLIAGPGHSRVILGSQSGLGPNFIAFGAI